MGDYVFVEVTDKMREQGEEIKVKGNDITFNNPTYKLVKHAISVEFEKDEEGEYNIIIKRTKNHKFYDDIIYDLNVLLETIKNKITKYIQKRLLKFNCEFNLASKRLLDLNNNDETEDFIKAKNLYMLWKKALDSFIDNSVNAINANNYLKIQFGDSWITIYDFYDSSKIDNKDLPKDIKT